MRVRVECEGAGVIDIDQIRPLQGNLKDLTEENYEKLKKEIIERGFSAPFFIWDKENKILDGTQRWNTLQKMRAEGFEIPALPYNTIHARSKKEAMQKLLAFTSAYGKMTSQGLYEFMSESEISFEEAKESFRFAEVDFDRFEKEFFDTEESAEGEDDVPASRSTTIQPGDLFILGNHRLLCGDATKKEDVERLMNGESVDMVFTDPPYNMGFEYNAYDDSKSASDYRDFCEAWFQNLMSVADKIIITPGTKNLGMWCQIYIPKHVACWIKKNWITSCSISNLQQWEPILFYGDHERKRSTDLYEINRIYQKDLGNEHTCPKQMEFMLEVLIYAEKSVLDVFLGSGSTLIACEKTNRRCFGMEIDPEYIDVIIRRWESFTNGKAEIFLPDGSKRIWSEVEQERRQSKA